MANCVFETYENYAMPNGNNIFNTSSEMATKKMCEYPSLKYALIHWKCVLGCFA